jgi:hypothetical protein
MSTSRKLAKTLDNYTQNTDQGQATDSDNWASKAFTGQYFDRDEYDTIYEIKEKLSGTKNRIWPVTDSEAKYLVDKAKQLELINFHEFLQKSYGIDASNPVLMKWAQDMFPEFWSMREEMIDQNAFVQTALAKIRLFGPRSRDDFQLLFGISTGRVTVPEGSIYDPKKAEIGPHARGLFNPLRNVGSKAKFEDNARLKETGPAGRYFIKSNGKAVEGLVKGRAYDGNRDEGTGTIYKGQDYSFFK